MLCKQKSLRLLVREGKGEDGPGEPYMPRSIQKGVISQRGLPESKGHICKKGLPAAEDLLGAAEVEWHCLPSCSSL